MDLLSFFLSQHAAVHARDVSGRSFPAQRVFDDLSDSEMRRRPGRALNSLVWLLWHMARTEDVAVNVVVAGGEQVLDGEWVRRMNVPWHIIGTGRSEDEVAELTARADIASASHIGEAGTIRGLAGFCPAAPERRDVRST